MSEEDYEYVFRDLHESSIPHIDAEDLDDICLDGHFSLGELERLVWALKDREGK